METFTLVALGFAVAGIWINARTYRDTLDAYRKRTAELDRRERALAAAESAAVRRIARRA